MPILNNPRHEAFAQAMAKGAKLADAHKQAGFSGKKASACDIAKRPDVSERIKELQSDAASVATWSIADRLAFLREAAATPPDELTISSRVCQGERLTREGRTLIVPDKLKAVELYSKLAGDFKERVEVSGDGLLELLEAVRGGKEDR